MSTRWFNVMVVLFWLTTMGWLVVEKIAPPLMVGEPPNYRKILAEQQQADDTHVVWQLLWNDKPLGSATSDTQRGPDGVTELQTRLHLTRLPVREIVPAWLAPQFESFLGDGENLEIDARSNLELNRAGRLDRFQTSVKLADFPDAIRVSGRAEDNRLKITFRSGEFNYETATDLSGDQLIGDALSPRTRLSELKLHQTWTEPVYSPFNSPNNPLQILQAKVEREEPLVWNGEVVSAWLVVYRNDSGAKSDSQQAVRGRTWVRRDGTVLQQEVPVLGSKLSFVRLAPETIPVTADSYVPPKQP